MPNQDVMAPARNSNTTKILLAGTPVVFRRPVPTDNAAALKTRKRNERSLFSWTSKRYSSRAILYKSKRSMWSPLASDPCVAIIAKNHPFYTQKGGLG